MKTKLLLIAVTAFAALAIGSKAAPAGTLQIVHSIDMPAPSGFRHDIAWGGEHLWTLSVLFEGLPDPNELARVHQLSPSDGSLVSTFTLGFFNHDGLGWDGSHLWIGNTNCLADRWDHGTQSDTLPDSVEMFSTDGTLVRSLSAPHSPDAVTQGITWDGNHLWLSDRKHREIIEVDPSDGSVITTFSSPGTDPDSLAWDGNSLWNLDLAADVIYRLDTLGNVLDTWSVAVTDPVGLTFDGQYLWVLDDHTDKAFQVVIPEPSMSTLVPVAGLLVLLRLRRR